ncbi:MAG: gamma-glutamyltransferase family protein [Myxococcota bacterium]
MEHAPPLFESNRSPVLSTRGLVATSQPLATAAGLRILRQGGNAADAAVAAAAALNVTEPCNTGIGGDCFALYYDAGSGAVSALNGSGRSPAQLDLERLEREGFAGALPRAHPHTVTVPGACAGWSDLLERHGRRTLAEVLEPAIELADEGFPVGPNTAFLWSVGARHQLAKAPGGHELTIDGRAPRAGEIFRNPGLARTFRRIAAEGPGAFYRGEIAEAIVAVLREHGGAMDTSDLEQHHSTWDEPISTEYAGLRVWECPPNGQGLVALLALNLLRGFDLGALPERGPERAHLMIEAMRLAFADGRRFVADPSRAGVPVEELLSEDYAERRRAQIDPTRARPEAMPGDPIGGSDTVYLCTTDAAGNACSFINSNYMAFGTGIVPSGWGFTLQNRGMGFSLEPDHPNALAPRKRPYHTIIPGLATRADGGGLYGPFGVMGGFMQPQGHVQVVVAMADDGADPQVALDRPRFNLVDGTPDSAVAVEQGWPADTLAELERRGHDLRRVDGWGRVQFGRGQIIRRDPSGTLWGGSDPRADGCAMAP